MACRILSELNEEAEFFGCSDHIILYPIE